MPVQNNAPLTASPDVYLNWPPLYGMLVGMAFRIFGASETTQHLLALALNFASAGLVCAIVRRRGSDLAGALACLAVLTTPALMRYGQMGSQLHLAIFLAQFQKCMHGLLIAAARQARGDALPTMPMRWNHRR